MIDVLNKDGDKEINVSEYFKRFTMDSIWNCAFGVDINMQYEKDNLYFQKCEEVFRFSSNLILPQYLGIYFHEFKEFILSVLSKIMVLKSKFFGNKNLLPYFWLRSRIGELVRKRQIKDNLSKKDYIQLLLDATNDFKSENAFNYLEVKKILSPMVFYFFKYS